MKIPLFLIIIALGLSLCFSGGPFYYCFYYPFISLPTEYNSSANTSICVNYQDPNNGQPYIITSSFGAQDCRSIGEAILVGRYIHLGFHNQGSFGTQISLYFASTIVPSMLGLLVDYDRNGFHSENASVPGFVGDSAISPLPVEGDTIK